MRNSRPRNALGCALAVSIAALMSGCACRNTLVTESQQLPNLVGSRVTVLGTAMDDDGRGAIVFGGNDLRVFVGRLKSWPTNHNHHIVKVTGILARQYNPDRYLIRRARYSDFGVGGSIDAAEVREVRQLLRGDEY